MFKPTDKQLTLMESQFLISSKKAERLRKSWAHQFRTKVLPLVDEAVFADAFHPTHGRPNYSIRTLVAIHLLKEIEDLTDRECIEMVEFSLLWHYALAVDTVDVHVCQKTLHNFRALAAESARAEDLFARLTKALAGIDNLSVSVQRLDSTHIVSNIAMLNRLGLFVRTVEAFLKALQRDQPKRYADVDGTIRDRYVRENHFDDAKKSTARRNLDVAAQDALRLIAQFQSNPAVSAMSAYQILERLFDEQCEIRGPEHDDEDDDTEAPTAAPDERDVGAVHMDGDDDDASCSLRDPHQPTPNKPEDCAESLDDDDVDDTARAAPQTDASREPEQEKKKKKSPLELEQARRDRRKRRLGLSREALLAASALLLEPSEIGSATLQSPFDPDATFGHKGKGFELQLCETADKSNPYQLITAVALNGAHESDQHALIGILDQLETTGLQPDVVYADAGYGSGRNIVAASRRNVILNAPVRDPRIETATRRGTGLDDALTTSDFDVTADYDTIVSCPTGKPATTSRASGEATYASFDGCSSCGLGDVCPTNEASSHRWIRRTPSALATERRQAEQLTSEWAERYKLRAGIECANAELKGRHGAGSYRVRGKRKMEVVSILKTLAMNVKRVVSYGVEAAMKETVPAPG